MTKLQSSIQIPVRNTLAPGVTLRQYTGYSLLHFMTRGDRDKATELLARQLNMSIPTCPNTAISHTNGMRVLCFGDKRWLVHAPVPDWKLEPVEGCAVTDLSDSRVLFCIKGEPVREQLARVCTLDLASSACAPGGCALTQFEQIPVLLHVNDNCSYDLYVENSFSEDLMRVLTVKK